MRGLLGLAAPCGRPCGRPVWPSIRPPVEPLPLYFVTGAVSPILVPAGAHTYGSARVSSDNKDVQPGMQDRQSTAFTPLTLGELELRNRVVRAGCFEGLSPGGLVSDRLIEHHRSVAAGGVAMTTVSYCAVSADGRAFEHELWMRPEVLPGLKALTEAVHAEGAAVCLQLGHCGFFASPAVINGRPLGASPKFCLYRLSWCREMTLADIEQKVADFVQAAVRAREAGFDAIELHAGHGYLLSQFLSPWTNRRTDAYGGALENRLRFPTRVIHAVRQAVGPGFPVLVKMNVRDGMRGGLELDEAVVVAQAFAAAGATALIPSCGFTARTPLYMLRGRVPVREMACSQPGWGARLGTTLFGRLFVQHYPFTPRFLEAESRRLLGAVNIPVGYVGGVTSLVDVERLLEEGFAFVQVGRATIRDPEFVNRLRAGKLTESDCDHCNRCVAAMSRDGVRCFLRDRAHDFGEEVGEKVGEEAVPAQRVALVTGACSGIGREIARELARRGYSLVLVSNRKAALEAAAAELTAQHGVPTYPIVLDLARPDAAAKLHIEVKKLSLDIDVLVSNAGILLFGEVSTLPPEQIHSLLNLHVVTPSLLARFFGREMRDRRRGHVLIVSSLSALRDFPGIAFYGSSKRYLLSLANALREELRPWGVRVTCLAPGAVATDLYSQTSVPVARAVKYRVMLDPARVARAAVDGMFRGKDLVIPGFSARVLGWAMRLTPRWVIRMVRERSGLLPMPGGESADRSTAPLEPASCEE